MACGTRAPSIRQACENWDLDDPAGLDLTAVRPIRDEIARRVRALLDDQEVTTASEAPPRTHSVVPSPR
jgi:hypothetical protein